MHRTVCVALAACALALVPAASASAASSYDDDTVIVKWKPGVSLAERLAVQEAAGVQRTLDTIHGIRAKVVQVSGDPADVARVLDRSPLVEYAEVNGIVRLAARPNDARFGDMWALENTGQATQVTAPTSSKGTPDADIDAPEAWAAAGLQSFPATGGATVAVIDTGVQDAHQDLAGKIVGCATSQLALAYAGGALRETACADENGHGTHVSGTIAARANNATGIAGVAFNSPLIVCKALHGAAGLDSDVANCLTWAHDRGAKVISMSLTNGFSQTQQDAARYAWENGGPGASVLVAAAGNNGSSTLQYPASLAEVVSVGATDNKDRHAQFSNYNADVEISAPGMDVLSTYHGGTYRQASGTSMATPHVSGAAALIWTLNPGMTGAQVRAKLATSVDDLGPAGRDHEFGFGRLNLLEAVTP